MTRHAGWVLALGIGCSVMAGCSSAPLRMEMLLISETASRGYYLEPDGTLSLHRGGGLVEGLEGRSIYQTRLDEAAMKRLKEVILRSGFFLAEAPLGRFGVPGPLLRVNIQLGLWENRMDLRGTTVPSVSKIVAEMNRHLPDRYRLIYRPAAAGAEEDLRRHLR